VEAGTAAVFSGSSKFLMLEKEFVATEQKNFKTKKSFLLFRIF
jgi:hypothetical protein